MKHILCFAFAIAAAAGCCTASAQDAVKLTVETLPANSVISPLLFGHNIEHTRAAVYHGLSAQILRNRKFAGKPTGYFGGPMEWQRFGSEHTFINVVPPLAYTKHNCKTRSNRAAEINAVSLQNPIDGERGGIQQNNLPLKGKTEYVFKAVVNTPAADSVPLTVRFIDPTGKTLAEKTFDITGEKYNAYEWTFTLADDELNAALQLFISKRAELRLGAVSLLPKENFYGMRKDVVAKLKEIGAKQLRWPGGNFAGEYYWKDGLLPVDQRAPLYSYMPVETQTHTAGFDFHEIGIDEFIALCQEVGAGPSLTLNLSWEPSEESAQWVEYCNGGDTTEWGKKRIERGHKEPYNVKYWSLGNELGYGHMEGLNSPAEYARKAKQTIDAMRKVTPDLKFCSSGPNNSSAWRKAMQPIVQDIAMTSFHSYQGSFGTNGNFDFIRDAAVRNGYNGVIGHADGIFNAVRDTRNGMNKDGFDNVAISFDEWNTVHALHHEPSIIEGVMAAVMLCHAVNRADELGIGAFLFFQPINEGAMIVEPLLTSHLTAAGQVFSLLKAHIGNRRLNVKFQHPDLRCAASVDESGKKILTVVNTSYDKDVAVETGGGNAVMLDGSQQIICPGSRFAEKRNVKVDVKIGLPARSVLQIETE